MEIVTDKGLPHGLWRKKLRKLLQHASIGHARYIAGTREIKNVVRCLLLLVTLSLRIVFLNVMTQSFLDFNCFVNR